MSGVLNYFYSTPTEGNNPEQKTPIKPPVIIETPSHGSVIQELSQFNMSSMNPIDKLEDGTPIKKVVIKEKPFEVELKFQRTRILKIEEQEETMEQKVSKLETEVSNLREDIASLKAMITGQLVL